MDHELWLRSRPVRLHWAGWETDTHRLQQAGWSVSAHQDIARMQMGLALRHPDSSAYGASSLVGWEYMEHAHDLSMAPVDFGAHLMFGRDVVFNHMGSLPAFDAIDAQPQVMNHARTRLEHFAHFAPSPLVRNNPIVVPEESVADLMDRILKLQQPERTDRIRKMLRDPRGYMVDELPQQKFHAQILSFAA